MKLKKIASLALAGIMAVSMLAGCSGKGNENPGNDDPTPTASGIAAVLNDMQTGDVKVNFTDDTALATKLQELVSLYGQSANINTIKPALPNVTGLKYNKVSEGKTDDNNWNTATYTTWNNTFLKNNVTYDNIFDEKKGDLTGTYTVYDIATVGNCSTEEAAMNQFATAVINTIKGQNLTNKCNTAGLNSGDKYYGYEYNGTAAMASVKMADGTTDYFFVYTINQVVTEKTI